MLKGNENEGLSTSHFIHRNQSLQYAPFVDNTNWKPAESQLSAPSTSSSILSYCEEIPFLGDTSRLFNIPDEKDWPWVPIYQRKILPLALQGSYPDHDKGHSAAGTTNRSISAQQLANHQQGPEKTFTCKMCHRPFKDAKSAYFHTHTHLNWDELERKSIFHAKCEHCDKIFLNRKNLQRHINAHEGRKYHSCSICGKPFSTADSALGHTFFHMNKEELAKARETWRHGCFICNKRFRTSPLLRRHARSHAEETYFLDKGQFDLNYLQGANLEPVKYLEESFSHINYLTTHAKIIQKVKAVTCAKCGKKFNSNSAMVLHLNGVHLKLRHPCPQCGKSFTQKGNLGSHLKRFHPMERFENIQF
ncbi:zinc finger protein 320 [Folsomia candida]|uniref:Zinc finger and SCAN domain-containing protein 2 n=1 Tax=Folsomia candida TaxID=158441 RepID=A0A226DE90_FOLCA|nr:zinc finger protein 320 [Folsomia candida]OXA43905.1 Zinc finger and SCAN domain-containing protein 2 [Folsomia candida]